MIEQQNETLLRFMTVRALIAPFAMGAGQLSRRVVWSKDNHAQVTSASPRCRRTAAVKESTKDLKVNERRVAVIKRGMCGADSEGLDARRCRKTGWSSQEGGGRVALGAVSGAGE